MMHRWPTIRLGDVLELKIDAVPIDPAESYKIAGVYSFGRGLLARGPLLGSETTYKVFHRLHEGDFVMSQLKAWEGALAKVPGAFDGWFLSPQFPTFRPVEGKLDISYFDWYCKQLKVWESLRSSARGMGARRDSVSPQTFLSMLLALPPLEKQRRIMGRIEELAAKIEEARGLRRQAVKEAQALLASASEAAFIGRSNWTEARVRDFCEHPQYGYTAAATTEEVGPRFLRITDIQNGRVNWDEVPFCQCPNPEKYLLQNNDLVFTRTGATTGKSFLIRDCPKAVFASYLIRLRVQRLVTVEYLYRYFQTPFYWSQITDEKKGTGQPNVNGKKLANIRVPIAPPEEQLRIVAYLDELQAKVDALKRLQEEGSTELDAMLPSILDKAFRGSL